MLKLTARERVLLHLLDYTRHTDAVEVPLEMTQEGIARAAWFDLAHFSEYIQPFGREGLFHERMAHVKGVRQRRKVYGLTEAGRSNAIRIRDGIRAEVVRIRDATGVREATIGDLTAATRGTIPLLEIVRRSMEGGVVDLTSIAPSAAVRFVEMTADAPRLKVFVGRQKELEALAGDDGVSRIFVVRGVAGIGKSSLGTKACELLRGRRNLFWHRVRSWDTTQSILSHLGTFLSAIGRPGLPSALARGDVARAAQILREDLPGTRSFLVFDDAHEASSDVVGVFRTLRDAIEVSPDVRALVLSRRSLPFYDRRDVALSALVRELDLGGLASTDVETLWPAAPGDALRTLIPQLKGHPLFIELLRVNPAAPSSGLENVRRFIEEEIYRNLAEPERRVMKFAALYRIPVPRDALLPDPGVSHDSLLSLIDRSLLRPVGEGRFEAHDVIRDFFASVLAPAERRVIAAFAADQLKAMATDAHTRGEYAACVNCLSNSLELSGPGEGRGAVLESLGDAEMRLGDLHATTGAYEEALRLCTQPEISARLHRKMAWALCDRSNMDGALQEVEEGLRWAGEIPTLERGWLFLVRCRVLVQRGDFEEADECGEEALRTFQAFGSREGEALALAELARTKRWPPLRDFRRSGECLEGALGLAYVVQDPEVRVRVCATIARLLALGFGDAKRSMELLTSIERMPGALKTPIAREQFLEYRGIVNLYLLGDFESARRDFTEALEVARQVRYERGIIAARAFLGALAFYETRFDDARALLEETATEQAELAIFAGFVESLFMAAQACLLQRDLAGFQRILATLNDYGTRAATVMDWIPARIPSSLRLLIDGDSAACRASFEALLRESDAPAPARAVDLDAGVVPDLPDYYSHHAHYFYGIALRVMCRDEEAAGQIARALDDLRKMGRHTRLKFLKEMEPRFVESLRGMTAPPQDVAR